MYKVEVHKRIHQAILLFDFIGLLKLDNETIFRKYGRNMYLFVYIYFLVSLAVGAYQSNNKHESILLTVMLIGSIVQTVRLSHILWKKEEMLEIIHRLGTTTIQPNK